MHPEEKSSLPVFHLLGAGLAKAIVLNVSKAGDEPAR